ncbi:predicted protein [Uncinocarpus reesii 1704]|uniref:Uncharacterized protein n=1 Tax=Uncinocarpus reesii (strain UAMH 1704) TaxID=336963 RepID=C4JFA0_UNCRE|nr:uncharacterized protein UREG_02322 [Uncinocarpus reesii 1704]EEP77473.1 predicted protein [Uncinocarpus reesii 1704]
MGKAGRIACIFTPYALSIASLVCLVLVALGATKPSDPLNTIYFLKADLHDIKTDSLGIGEDLYPIGKGLQQAQASGKLHDYYIVGLWNHCYKDGENGDYKCSEKKAKYWFDPIDVWDLGDDVREFIPDSLEKGLNTYKTVAKWLFIAYAVAIAANVVQLVVGISAIFSRWGSLATTVFAGVHFHALHNPRLHHSDCTIRNPCQCHQDRPEAIQHRSKPGFPHVRHHLARHPLRLRRRNLLAFQRLLLLRTISV